MILIEDRLQAALTHQLAGRGENALLIYQSVLDISPLNLEALKGAAATLIALGRAADAMPLAAQAVTLAGADLEALKLLAVAAQQSQDGAREAAALGQAERIAPHDPETAGLRAAVAMRAGDLPSCEKILVDALAVHPGDAGLMAALSQTYMTAGLVADALDYSDRALTLKPENAEYRILRGAQLALTGDYASALALFESAILMEPGNVLLMAYLSDAYSGLGQLSEAQTWAQRAIGLRRDVLPAWRAYVKVKILRGEGAEALRQLAEIARQHADRVEALITLADAYRLAGEHRQALLLLEPLAARMASLPASQALAAAALQRDCRLSLGLVEEAGAAMSRISADGGDREARPMPIELLAGRPVIIGADMSLLEALPLLRFRLPRDGQMPLPVRGPSAFADVLQFMPGLMYRPFEEGGAPDDGSGIPLAAMLALPEHVRGPVEMTASYIEPPAARCDLWRQTFADLPRPLVAVAWNAARPGLLLEDLRPALEDFRGTLVAIVWDEGRHQLAAMPEILDAACHFSSIGDLAAVLAEVDAVIGPEGLSMHIAGAMGRPGAVLVQPNAPWYWCEKDRELDRRALWYPSITVLRSGAIGHWAQRRDDIVPTLSRYLLDLAGDGIEVGHEVAASETRISGEVA